MPDADDIALGNKSANGDKIKKSKTSNYITPEMLYKARLANLFEAQKA